MIIGATPEHDYEILSVAESLYRKFDLKRVFYSAFVKVNEDKRPPGAAAGRSAASATPAVSGRLAALLAVCFTALRQESF